MLFLRDTVSGWGGEIGVRGSRRGGRSSCSREKPAFIAASTSSYLFSERYWLLLFRGKKLRVQPKGFFLILTNISPDLRRGHVGPGFDGHPVLVRDCGAVEHCVLKDGHACVDVNDFHEQELHAALVKSGFDLEHVHGGVEKRSGDVRCKGKGAAAQSKADWVRGVFHGADERSLAVRFQVARVERRE
eukprot:453866-Rhodomonas_salina.1